MEHRWGQRFKVAIEARLRLHQRLAAPRGRVASISASGAFIRTNMPIPVLTCIQVEIQMPASEGLARWSLPACVVRRTRGGIGVEWCDAESFVVADLVALYGKQAAAPMTRALVPVAGATPPLAPGLADAPGHSRPRAQAISTI